MSSDILGNGFDIHGGGQDLIFPHHENEIAQSESCHDHKMANYWIHNGFVNVDGFHEKIPQTGNVIIGKNVEIGSNCSIDRATIGSTIIGEMTKIDNLVHIAHNVKIGKGCLITASFAVAGSTEIGDFCTFAGQVGIAPHLKIGNNSVIASKAGVTKSLLGEV